MRGDVCLGLALSLAIAGGAADALDLTLPATAERTRAEASEADTYALPVGPYAEGGVPTRTVEGRVARRAWRIEGEGRTTLQLFTPLREQLAAQGYETVFRCRAASCGGFDFRFGIAVLPAPDMFVDLFDYRFLSARKADGDTVDHVSVLVSRAGGAGYVQVVSVGQAPLTETRAPAGDTATPDAGDTGVASLVERMRAEGHVVLPGLDFETGSAALAERSYAALRALAGYLAADPARRIALVGHTDRVGELDSNMDLSKRRAASVVERLVDRHGVAPEKLEAHGVGYLSPRAPNATSRGREMNRRVEAVPLDGD
jgi:OOP family OmpA-OmpF porin